MDNVRHSKATTAAPHEAWWVGEALARVPERVALPFSAIDEEGRR